MNLESYVKNWESIEGAKPCNEKVFVDGFIDFLGSLDDVRDLEHEGNNYQEGQQLVICKDATYSPNLNLHFEINYCPKFIKVYRANHDGYRVAEYLDMKRNHPRYSEVAISFYSKLFELWQLPRDLSSF